MNSMDCIIIEPERSLLYANFSLKDDIRKQNVTFALLIARPPSNYFNRILNLSVDLCKFFKESQGNRFFNIAYKIILANSNAPKKCPLTKGSYYFRNIDLGGNLPPFLPTNDFQVQLNIVSDVDWLLNITSIGRAVDFIKWKGK
ncbi:uncharacterized protein LOC133846244 [Drosophila sulfurigaster albostrigata]|uniref:uncharacterized protein LOC133846244 n=1 Tax=Drosophila sulfurigaster albostrigata TaxID=89887 RepID=UPI002D21AFB9|nr:uncharacterized protein LOC133846244 [Drosophila sulfurigaster albostrigata]